MHLVKKNYALSPLTISQIGLIRDSKALPTDTAAVAYAVGFCAALAKHEVTEIKGAVAILDQLRKHHEAGSRLCIEDARGNKSYLMVLGL